ncbi:MAG: hypothetical protein ABIH23_15985 [bacterium]
MNRHKYLLRYAIETAVLLGILASVPHLYSLFSCGSYPWYTPHGDDIAAVAGTPHDKPGAVRTIVNGKVAVFTEVLFPLGKGHLIWPFIPYIWWTDIDRCYLTGPNDYTDFKGQVRWNAISNPGDQTVQDWVIDGTWNIDPLLGEVGVTLKQVVSDGMGLTFRVQDRNHLGPPGDTDDDSDWIGNSAKIAWLAPEYEWTDWVEPGGEYEHYSNFFAGNKSEHQDFYLVQLFTTSPWLSFTGLYVHETLGPPTNPCAIPCDILPPTDRQLQSDPPNSVWDQLGKKGEDTQQGYTGCEIHVTQGMYLRDDQDHASPQVFLHNNTLKWFFLAPGRHYDLATMRITPDSSDHCNRLN